MKALVFYEHGGLDQLQYADLPEPVVGPHEALVQVKAVALNHLDLWVRAGIPGLKLALPHIGGSDVAGGGGGGGGGGGRGGRRGGRSGLGRAAGSDQPDA